MLAITASLLIPSLLSRTELQGLLYTLCVPAFLRSRIFSVPALVVRVFRHRGLVTCGRGRQADGVDDQFSQQRNFSAVAY